MKLKVEFINIELPVYEDQSLICGKGRMMEKWIFLKEL